MREFQKAYEALGGTITSVTPYNEKQSSYASEATAAMEGDPEALYLISYPVDGATIARAWISQGGRRHFLLNDGMNSSDFIEAVGAKYLEDAYGTSSGTSRDEVDRLFLRQLRQVLRRHRAGRPRGRPLLRCRRHRRPRHRQGQADGEVTPAAITKAIPEVVDPKGTVI